MSAKIEARVSHRFSVGPERAYDLWLDPAAVRAWMASALRSMGLAGDLREVSIDARSGGGFVFADQRGDALARHWGTYLELDRPRRIVFTWITDPAEAADPSVVTVTFEPAAGGCLVTVVHQMDSRWADYLERTAAGWGRMLAGMESAG